MNYSSMINYAGMIVVMFFVVFIIFRFFNSTTLIEGMSGMGVNASHVSEGIKNNVSNIIDNLHIDKYRRDYEDIIINLDEWCSAEILKSTISNTIDVSKGLSDSNLKIIRNINDLNTFKDTLNKTMTHLDSSK